MDYCCRTGLLFNQLNIEINLSLYTSNSNKSVEDLLSSLSLTEYQDLFTAEEIDLEK